MGDHWREHFAKDRYAAITGIELVEFKPGYAKARLEVGEQHLNALGTVHGGAIFTLADFAFGAASNCYGPAVVAAQVSISYLRAARRGVLYAEAKEVSRGRKIGNYEVCISNDSGEKVALFHGTGYIKSERMASEEKPGKL